MTETTKPSGMLGYIKDFTAPIGTPSWTREKLDSMAENANAGLRAADRAIQSAFSRIDTAIEKDPDLPKKVVYGAMLAGLLGLDYQAISTYPEFAQSYALQPHEKLTFIESAAGFLGLLGYVYAHRILGLASVGESAYKVDVLDKHNK